MSEFAKPDEPSDTQDTFFEESQSDSQLIKNAENSTNFGESQDFHLIDTHDSQDLEADLSEGLTKDSGVINTEDVSMEKESNVTEKTTDDNENKEDIFNENQTLVEQDDDDEDVVHGTPPHCLSSPSKKLNINADIKSLKRKAGSLDDSIESEHLFKKNKINSSEDELKKTEAMEADTVPLDNTDQDSQQVFPPKNLDESVIIPETQGSMQDTQPVDEVASKDLKESGNMKAENNLEQTPAKNLNQEKERSFEEECDLVNEAISKVNQNDSTSVNVTENDLSNQNLSVNDDDLNESKNVSDQADFSRKESKNLVGDKSSKDEVIKKETEVSENQSEAKCESRAQEVKLEESKPLIEEADKTKSIEDTLKQLGEEMDFTKHLEQPSIEKESTESELLAALTDSDTNADVEENSENIEESVKMETEDIPEKIEIEKKVEVTKSRMSIEVIYDRASLSQAKPAEVVEIDDDGEKIILDSSQEDGNVRPEDISKDKSHRYKPVGNKDSEVKKSETHLTNGSNISKKTNANMDSDAKDKISKETISNAKSETGIPNPSCYVISDGEGDSIIDDSKNKSTSDNDTIASTVKTLLKDINVCVRLKCLVTIDENTKEIVGKELLTVNCESTSDQNRNNDTSASLADISGNENKDNSPGSVTSATYPRFSIMSTSTVSSTTSSSSAGSSKISGVDNKFSVPKGPAKHSKKIPMELEQLSKEWKNCHLVSTSVLNFVNSELVVIDLQNGVVDSLEEPLRKIHASTPEATKETPQRNSKKGRPPKRLQRGTRKRTKITTTKVSPNVIDSIQEDSDDVSSFSGKETKSKSAIAAGSSTPAKKAVEGLRNSALPVEEIDELLGKEVFAKWSDNHYYAGIVVDKTKAKYKVNFLDGKNKQLIPEFIIPIPNTLNKGLSVYTLTKEGDYGPCGIIVDVLEANNVVKYVIEPDEGKRITVQIKDIFLTGDQAQVLKEEALTGQISLPSTPHSISKVSLDNMVDGKRRSRRNASITQTPKSKKSLTSIINKTSSDNEPSVSGVAFKSKELSVSDKEGGKSSDASLSVVEENGVYGVQREIIGTFCEQVTTKGPQSRLKGKQRNRKKPDDQETIDLLGPIPEPNSKIFEGMSFLLTCASLDGIDKYHTDNGDSCSNSETGTDHELDWQSRPFVRERLEQQLIAGGGKVYENFDLLPANEYESTKLITNLPNLTAKSLLCLSVGISAYNHLWVIRSCKDNKAVNPSEEKLPAGWSIDRKCYVEMFHRREQKPLTHIIAVIPCKESVDKDFVAFWSRICLNAGGQVRVVDNDEISFVEGTVVLTNHRCPTWVMEKAKNWDIPLVSTTWLVQSLIEGKILPYDLHRRFKPF